MTNTDGFLKFHPEQTHTRHEHFTPSILIHNMSQKIEAVKKITLFRLEATTKLSSKYKYNGGGKDNL